MSNLTLDLNAQASGLGFLTESPSPVQIERATLGMIPVPSSTHTWRPVPHTVILDEVEDRLQATGTKIVDESFTVTHGGRRLFGVLRVEDASAPLGIAQSVGLRNAHDQAFAAGIAAGMQVLVCSNLSFAGDIVFKRRHTVNVMRDLPGMVRDAVDGLQVIWQRQRQQVEAYRNSRLREHAAHDLVIRALDAGVISGSRIPKVLAEWREPQHVEFRPRTVWSFFNSVTEALRGSNMQVLPKKTEALHAICDARVGLS